MFADDERQTGKRFGWVIVARPDVTWFSPLQPDDVLARARSGPYLGERRSVRGRPSIKLARNAFLVSIL